EALKLMSEGRSKIQVAAEFKISYWTLRNWLKQDSKQELALAIEMGETAFEAYWEGIGHKGIKGVLPKFNAAAWSRTMAVRCGKDWVEKSNPMIEIKGNDISKMTNKEIDVKIKALLEQRKKNPEEATVN
ncbi:MAG TPA: helix-turn-helix domain-containing protein, partial [Nitrososphaeraceae archaeon]